MGNILGMDYGARRIGLAIADEHARQAFPRTVLQVSSMEDALKQLQSFIQSEEVVKVVIGRPLNLQSEETKQTSEVDAFVAALKNANPDLAIETEEERLSSIAAQRALREKGDRGRTPPDAVAALLILETYLDRSHDQ